MKSTVGAILLSLSLGLSATGSANGQAVTVEVVSLTSATYFKPLSIAARDRDLHLFQIGTPASDSLQAMAMAMAEGGVLTELIGELTVAGGNHNWQIPDLQFFTTVSA